MKGLIPPLSRLQSVVAVIGFASLYVLFDWASYIDPYRRLNITPWNPGPSLAVAFLLARGPGGVVTVLGSMMLSDLVVRPHAERLALIMLLNIVLAIGYQLTAHALRAIFPNAQLFHSRSELGTWLAVIASCTFLTSLCYIFFHSLLGLISPTDFSRVLVSHWLGDAVGIVVFFPLIWTIRMPDTRATLFRLLSNFETHSYIATSIVGLWIAFGIGAEFGFRYFYILFLPVVWAAARHGFAGSIISVATMQVGMIIGEQLSPPSAISVAEIQYRVLALATIGFFIGAVVEEHRKALQHIRDSVQLVAAGQMGVAIAHELNQPLSAVSTYSSACRLLVSRGEYHRLPEVAESLVVEAERASSIVRRIRGLFGSEPFKLRPVTVQELLDSAIANWNRTEMRQFVSLKVTNFSSPNCAFLGEPAQLELLMRNLLVNAAEATIESLVNLREVSLTASETNEAVVFKVSDTGPGIPQEMMEKIFDPFFTTKARGMGVGLSICREIALGHGGQLYATPGPSGCLTLELPAAERTS